ncbi:MAG: Do family serine endopeptidase [Salinisphaera sp.]|jgi:serine protease Do|nr:Do family serine endopeptidase [Salinisphaera sp.]
MMRIVPARLTVLGLLVCSTVLIAGCGDGDGTTAAKSGPSATADAGHASAKPAQPIAGLPDFSGLVREVSPAVVNISATPPVEDRSHPNADSGPGNRPSDGQLRDWLHRFFGDGPQGGGDPGPTPQMPDDGQHVSLGSGFIISSDGYILTNRHVIAGAGQVVVKLNDRRQLVAKVVGADADSDVAVLKVDAKNLPTVKIGDPNRLPVGAWVVAIGSPFGFETSVTAGIVSAKQRSLADDQYVPFLQTDVAINPGNSGGPLFNLAGEVVGINSQIYSQTGGYQGLSFAIPIDIAMNAARQLREKGHVTRGWLGVQIQDVDRKLAQSFKLNRPEGALVAQVLKNSPAAAAGLTAGDVILAFNGHAVDSATDLPPLVGAVAPGQEAPVKILRDGSRQTINVKIEALPAHIDSRGSRFGQVIPKPRKKPFGLTLESLDTRARHALGLERGGVKVTAVAPGAGARAGLRPGDVVLAIGSKHIEDAGTLVDTLKNTDGPVALLVLRDSRRLYLPMDPGRK